MTTLPARPAIPARPAAYIRLDATADDPYMLELRNTVLLSARDLGWPMPVVYADAGQPGSQLAALAEAITAGRHDGVITDHPAQLSHDLAQIEGFDRLCRQHGVRLRFRQDAAYSGALFDVIYDVRDFTVTDEHLRLLRRAYVAWDDAEFGAPQIDPKRPYGNSWIEQDMAEILGVPRSEWEDEEDEESGLLPEARWRFLRLHAETAIALQIALATGEFRTGRYVRHDQ